MKKPWELEEPWFVLTAWLAGTLMALALIIPVLVFT